jgi:hypothetical protein
MSYEHDKKQVLQKLIGTWAEFFVAGLRHTEMDATPLHLPDLEGQDSAHTCKLWKPSQKEGLAIIE